MENLPRLLLDTPTYAAESPASAEQRKGSGIWSLEGDHLASIESFEEGPAVVLVRSEHVLIQTIELPPFPNAARRRAALPFAIEDRIAEPLEEVHVALGAEVGPNRFIVGIVRHDLMRQWVLRMAEAGLKSAALVPDALSLPVPGPATWSVDVAASRAMVRVPDGSGFALPLGLLDAAWIAADRPSCIAYGDPLPPLMAAPQAELEVAPLAERLLLPALDLRQGPYAPPRRPVDPLWKRIAIVAALGALAHSTIAVADTLMLSRIAAERDAEVRALAAATRPSLILGPDLGTTIAAITPDGDAAGPSQFLILLGRAGGALAGLEVPVVWRSVNFDQRLGTLTIAVEADNIAGLQRVASALADAGLNAQPGAAAADPSGRAVGTFAVKAS